MSEIRAVLFDMGGVIVQLDSLETVLGPSELSATEIWNAWILSDAVQQYERGQSTLELFAETMVSEMRLVGTAADFVTRFLNFPQGLYPGAVELVQSVPRWVTTGVLSNTNAVHWDNQKDAETVRGLCERNYLSYELGLAKPERGIFDFAVADLGLAAHQVLFIDDNQINVDGAIAAGLTAGLAKGPDQATQILHDFGVLT